MSGGLIRVTRYQPLVLERGVTHDTEFEQWVSKVLRHGAGFGNEVALTNFRKDNIVELYNEAGQLVLAYRVYRCWVSEYKALPDLDANGSTVAIESIKLETRAGSATSRSRSRSNPPSYSVVTTSV